MSRAKSCKGKAITKQRLSDAIALAYCSSGLQVLGTFSLGSRNFVGPVQGAGGSLSEIDKIL